MLEKNNDRAQSKDIKNDLKRTYQNLHGPNNQNQNHLNNASLSNSEKVFHFDPKNAKIVSPIPNPELLKQLK